MAPTIAVLGTNGGTSFAAYGFDGALARIGMNTGNSLFQFALWNLIANPKLAFDTNVSADRIKNEAQHILIPAANQVNAAWDMSWLADLLDRCDLPVTCIGLGAQAEIGGDPRLDLKPGTIRYIKILSEKTSLIGLRGPFTQQVLEHFGVFNTIVTGCPSQTINPRLTGAQIQSQLDAAKEMGSPTVGYVLGTLESSTRQAERILAQKIGAFRHQLILQTDPRLLRVIYDQNVIPDIMSYFNWVRSVMRPDLNQDKFDEYFMEHAVFYSDARTWIDSMRRYDLVIGMRIHGAIAAIQSGKLGVCVAFDSRTKELAETMGYPYLPVDCISKHHSLNEILSNVIFDANKFDSARQRNIDSIYGILNKDGLYLS
ncbi:polysaccharide pyruvyl transferase family protein [Xanthobacter sp. TB0139]|uniref:polysaccharide pyruvyl transferase family protein n=1 Tax=Xanthobacter sp. TB0139 TaxID=3459178 RepID=UPI004039D738